MRRDSGMQAIEGLLLAIVVVGVIVMLFGCAHLAPASSCDPRHDQVRDAEHRVMGISDCYSCIDAPPGGYDEGNHYRCLDYTCNECEAPPVPLDKQRPDAGESQRDAP